VLAALAAAYFVAGKLGLALAVVHANASAVWPPTGIAIAGLLLFGPRVWPAVFVGAFLVNLTTAGTAATSLGIALGNTLEGVLGAHLAARRAGGTHAFGRPQDILRFALLAGLFATTISPTVGVTTLAAAGMVEPAAFTSVWVTWWLGDVGGALVVAPLILLWATRPRPSYDRGRVLEGLALVAVLLLVGFVVFGGAPYGPARSLSFLSLPVLLWAAFRFDPREAATATALLSGIAVWGCVRGAGPFASPNDSLVLVQAFMGVTGITTLTVAATVREARDAREAAVQSAALVESSAEAIIGHTLDGTIESWNHAAERLYGYSASEMVGRHVSTLSGSQRASETESVLDQLARGETVEGLETVHRRRDGEPVTVSLTLSPIRDTEGRVTGASVIARDVTRRKRGEQRLVTQFMVTRVLAESGSLKEAAPRLLNAVCEGQGWDAGALFSVARPGEPALERVGQWPEPADQAALARGEALARRVAADGAPLWERDEAGAAQVWPVRRGGEVVAVVAVLSRRARAARQELLDLMSDVGLRVEQFLEREEALQGLRRLKKAVETLQIGVTITDGRGHILYTNPAEAAMHGYRPEELIGRHVSLFMPPGWKPAEGRPAATQSWRRETMNVRRDGSIFPVQLLSDAVREPDGTPIAFVTCTEEITERRRAEDALRSSEERYRLLFERNLAGVYRATLRGRLLECNDAFAHILGYASRAEVLAHPLPDLFVARAERDALVAQLREAGALSNVEVRLRRRDGRTAWVLENETLLPGRDGEELVEGTLIDITDRKQFEQRIEFHAYHDPLTGLPNRTSLKERLETLLAQARRSGRALGVLFLDLDQFKEVNDTLGHSVGDRLLQQVAARLRECVREEDMVSRVGGDEFVLLLPHVTQAAATRIAAKILERMGEPIALDGHELYVTTSVGIAVFPDDGGDADSLLKNADSAMYRAKEGGRNAYQLWDKAAEPGARSRLATQSGLRRALEREELVVHYQPQVQLLSGRLAGVEALVRWRHPERGLLLPEEFVPVAEQSGLIVPVGEWVLRAACRAAKRWEALADPPLRVAVNLSVRQFQQPGLRETVAAVLAETGLPPERLELEITETAAMQSFDLTVPVLREFAAMGIGIAIDDLGTGYSSLSCLKLLPLRRLKIDRSFMVGIAREQRDKAIVKAIVRMAHSLGLGVVAEGVETAEQVAVLKDLRCDEGQGRVFSEALPASELEAFLVTALAAAPGPAGPVWARRL
jgi:diguanylate cyclase (GGDEF)-like protein/PAS domain S-box-containing protein